LIGSLGELPLPPHLRAYSEAGLWRERSLADMAKARASETPRDVAVIDSGKAHSFADLFDEATA